MHNLYELDIDKARATIQESIRRATVRLAIAREVEAALRPHDGKLVTRRFLAALQESLPEYTMYYNDRDRLKAISIWGGPKGNDLLHGDSMELRLHTNQNTERFDHALFSDLVIKGYLNLQQNIADMRMVLNSLEVRVVNYNHAVRQMEESSKLFGPASFILHDRHTRK